MRSANYFASHNFAAAFGEIRQRLKEEAIVSHPGSWQGEDVSARPEMRVHELLNVTLHVTIPVRSLWETHIVPNLPWADDHFEERVSGAPLNPGHEWRNWPWADSAAKFVTKQFNHSYPERMWPKRASDEPLVRASDFDSDEPPRRGIREEYGDLNDWVEALAKTPDTRQAYYPIYFPEDVKVEGRKPCTLGYQLIIREGKWHIYYPMRSCDFIRHMRDDVYLALKLGEWAIGKCRRLNDSFPAVEPGSFTMHCTSLHIFENDRREL